MKKNIKECSHSEHQFEPRYDVFEGKPSIGVAEAAKWREADDARTFLDGLSITKSITYVGDICIKCGKTIPRC